MKAIYPNYLGYCSLPLLLVLVSHCGGDSNRLVATASGGASSAGGALPIGGKAASGGAATGAATGGGISTPLCSPGVTQACLGPGQCAGAQACNITGTAWGPCDCGTGAGGTSGVNSSAGASAIGGASSIGGSTATGGVSTVNTGSAATASTGGTATTGGTSAATTGGSAPTSTGGISASGGNTTVGGTKSIGGNASTGGVLAIGGNETTGGVPSGGAAPTGGTNSTGSSMATGGAPAAGGATATGVCGNGVAEAGESCDLGSRNGLFYGDGTGCSKTCTQEPTCRNNGVTGACSTTCGDGNIDPNEACDDGNQWSNDGCSSTCQVETGFTCTVQQVSDAQPCPSNPALHCLVLAVTYRDFDGQQVSGGHPDFFYYGAPVTGGRTTGVVPGATTTTCIPNAAGTRVAHAANAACANNDQTGPCLGLVANALGPDGKPVYAKGTCPCLFTDWDNTGLLGSCPAASSTAVCTPSAGLTGVSDCWVTGPGSHHLFADTTVQVIQSADSFKQWYTDSTFSTKVLGTLELAATGIGQYQFSSSRPGAPAGTTGRTVYDDLHDICLATPHTGSLSSGFFPLESQARQKVCNIWPYWKAGLQSNCCAGGSCPVLTQWDPMASYDNCPTAGTGGPVPNSAGTNGQVNGLLRNFYFTTEVRYLFHYDGTPGTLQFYGDDDAWVFVNGQLALDLGATHERTQGSVLIGTGLTAGNTYEIAIFHADTNPRESNFQLTLSGFSTRRSVCTPH